MYCENCGHKITTPDAVFCPNCGGPIPQTAEDTENAGLWAVKEFTHKAVQGDAASDVRNRKASSKPLSKKALALIGGAAGVVVILVLLLIMIPVLSTGKEPILVIENGSLVYYEDISSEEGIIIEGIYGLNNEADTDLLARFAQITEDKTHVFYFSSDGEDLMLADLSQLKKNGLGTAKKTIASNWVCFEIIGNSALYSVENESTGSYSLEYYSTPEDTNYRISTECCPFSFFLRNEIGDSYPEYLISENGRYILYGEYNGIYLYDTQVHQKKAIAGAGYLIYYTEDFSQIMYALGDSVYLTGVDDGEIVSEEYVFSAPLNETELIYGDPTAIIYEGYDSDYNYVGGVYKDGLSITLDDNIDGIIPLGMATSIEYSFPFLSSVTGGGITGFVGFGEDGLLDSNFQSFSTNLGYADNVVWDPDHQILYVCFRNRDADRYDLYAYTMVDGTITEEKLIATNCDDEHIYYDSASKCLFYYVDYDSENDCGTLCGIYDGDRQLELVRNVYIDWSNDIDGLQFDAASGYILCWANVDDYQTGDLYVLDMDRETPVTFLESNVNINSWGVYDGDLLFIGNYNTGGTLFRFDGKDVTRERENVAGIITGASKYSYVSLFAL